MAKILVVDDDPELLRMIQFALERQGDHEAVLSADGADALAKAEQDPPDLAIIDVMMPGMTGYEMCQRLRQREETASIPIIILTARGQAVDRQAALDAGADEHMAKPVTMSELLEQVHAMLEAHGASQPVGVVALLSLRGGVGVTTLAVNLAATWVREDRGEVCLVDLCPSSGHVALQLGLRPEPNWADLMDGGAVDGEAIADVLLEHRSGLHLLASPAVPLVEKELPPSMVEQLLGTLSERFDILVVDMPPVLDKTTMAALNASATTCLVVNGEPASIQSTLGTIRALGKRADRSAVILNQPTREGQGSPESIERALRRSATGVVPFDPEQARALNEGKPLALDSPNSSLAAAVERLAGKLI